MKYELPKSLKRHGFYCNKICDFTNFNKCSTKCKQDNNIECWKKNLVDDFTMDCLVINENTAEGVARCPSCNSDVVSCAGNTFLCPSCGSKFELSLAKIKKLIGTKYVEVDKDELNSLFEKIK